MFFWCKTFTSTIVSGPAEAGVETGAVPRDENLPRAVALVLSQLQVCAGRLQPSQAVDVLGGDVHAAVLSRDRIAGEELAIFSWGKEAEAYVKSEM